MFYGPLGGEDEKVQNLVHVVFERPLAATVMAQVAATFLNENSKKRVTLFKSSPLWKLLEDFLAKRNSKKTAASAAAAKRGPLPPQVSEF